MYVQDPGIGFSLKPPKFVREAFAKFIQGTKVTLPPVTVSIPGGAPGAQVPSVRVGGGALPEPIEEVAKSPATPWVVVGAVAIVAMLAMRRRSRRAA